MPNIDTLAVYSSTPSWSPNITGCHLGKYRNRAQTTTADAEANAENEQPSGE